MTEQLGTHTHTHIPTKWFHKLNQIVITEVITDFRSVSAASDHPLFSVLWTSHTLSYLEA